MRQFATIEWLDPPTRPENAGPPFAGLPARDFALLRMIAEARYIRVDHARMVGFPSYHQSYVHLRNLERYGWLQRARLYESAITGSQFVTIYSLTAQGVQWLREIDPEWHEAHLQLEATAGRTLLKEHIQHELDRNTVVQALIAMITDAKASIAWYHGSHGAVRAFPFGPTGPKLAFTPDAVLDINDHIWLVEYERSWRNSTIVKKSRTYETYFAHRVWQDTYAFRPRVLLVLSEESTQDRRSLAAWSQHAKILHSGNAWATRMQNLQAQDDRLIAWNGTPPKMLVESWRTLNAIETP